MLVALLLQASLCYAGSMRALLIGIGKYPESSGWNEIHGDSDIDLIKTALLRQGFAPENIVELRNEAATKSAIVSAFSRLQHDAGKGDVIYIHFSGHGQQVTDLNGDEKDGLDEAWIPYDASIKFQEGIFEGCGVEELVRMPEVNKLGNK